ncbi:MAG: nucleotidyltransferase family protein [Anaerovoracaceae bacterium]|jgi:predicted nucleotidyltransferase
MRSIGIIAEFNPFHEGHRYLIENAVRASRADFVICVMSGDFTQRGEPALEDKWKRAEKAVLGGADVVFELPAVYALGNAGTFAEGGVRILEGLGVDILAFGSESGDLSELSRAAEFLNDQQALDPVIREEIKRGASYPKARMDALKQIHPEIGEEILQQPNNILAIEYLRRIRNMTPYTVQRKGTSYHDQAEAIRRRAREEDPVRFEHIDRIFFDLLRAAVVLAEPERLETLPSAGSGLGWKLKNELPYAESTEDLIRRIKSKAFTRTRISRLLTQAVLGLYPDPEWEIGMYARLLAASAEGREWIRETKSREGLKIPIITNINRVDFFDENIKKTLKRDIQCADIYNIITSSDLYERSDHVVSPYIGAE